MSSSKATRAVLSALILCVPALAASITPSIDLRIGGADQMGPELYAAYEDTTLSLVVQAQPGDLVALFAKRIDKSGDGPVATLIFDRADAAGMVTTHVKIPKGFAGESFELMAFGLDVSTGEIYHAPAVTVRVR